MTGTSERPRDQPGPPRLGATLRSPWVRKALKPAIAIVVIAVILYMMKFSPVAVSAHRVEVGAVVAEVMGTGTLEAEVEATISSKIQGRVLEVLVDQNDSISVGQILVRLESDEWNEQVAVASAGFEAAIATVERVRSDEDRARAILAQARLDNERALDLHRSGVASQADLDQSLERLRVAEAGMKSAEAAITEAERQRVVARKNVSYHQARLADTEILSPFDGLVVRRDRDPGDLVVPAGSILHVISNREMWVSAWVDETAMPTLAAGQPARVVFRSEPSKSYRGEVARLGRQVDRETREFLVDVRIAELPANWAVGQRAEVFIETARESSTLVIPRQLVLWRDGRPGVFILSAGKAHWRELTLGLHGKTLVEVAQGLEEGDEIIHPVDGRSGALREGKRVKTP